jgi:hypothetical protein
MTETTEQRIERGTTEWLRNGGEEELRRVLKKAERDNEQLRRDARVDWRTMQEPCTI